MAAGALAVVSLASMAAAAPATFLVPAGGEVWTAGATHTIEWSGGNPTTVSAVAYVEQFAPFGTVYIPNLAFFANNGTASWPIPAGLTPGAYKLAISSDGVTYSAEFTIKAPPVCLVGCALVEGGFPAVFPPGTALPLGACANSAAAAASLAQQFVYSQLSGHCSSGYTLDPGSVVIDVTVLPIGACYGGYTGGFVAEAYGFGCCCADPVATTPESWGQLKGSYR